MYWNYSTVPVKQFIFRKAGKDNTIVAWDKSAYIDKKNRFLIQIITTFKMDYSESFQKAVKYFVQKTQIVEPEKLKKNP